MSGAGPRTRAQEQNRTADLLITNETRLSAVLTHEKPLIQRKLNERCAQSYFAVAQPAKFDVKPLDYGNQHGTEDLDRSGT